MSALAFCCIVAGACVASVVMCVLLVRGGQSPESAPRQRIRIPDPFEPVRPPPVPRSDHKEAS